MSQPRIFCPFCKSEIQLDQDHAARKGIKASTILQAAGGIIAAPCVVAAAAGFGSAGIVGGSLAALWQASVGNVASGSAFAALQSMGATGAFTSGMAAGGAVSGAGAGARWWESRKGGRTH